MPPKRPEDDDVEEPDESGQCEHGVGFDEQCRKCDDVSEDDDEDEGGYDDETPLIDPEEAGR